jgi:drug/metabolite transporter (DMT)-like permease
MTTKTRAELVLLGTTVIWGGTFAIVKIGMREISPILLIAIRFTVAGAFVYLFARKSLFPLPASAALRGSLLGAFLFLGFVAQNIGLTITTASKSAFITGMMVAFVPLLQVLVERRMPKIGNVLGVAAVAAGLWFLTSPAGASFNAGDALTVVCAVFFAVYIIYLDIISKEMNTEQLVFLQMTSVAAFSWIVVACFETPVFIVSTSSLLAMGYLTFLATLLTTWVQTRYQKDTTPTRAVVIFSIEPVIASVIAAVLLGEALGTLGTIGGGLILAGVLVSELSDGIPVLNRAIDGSAG